MPTTELGEISMIEAPKCSEEIAMNDQIIIEIEVPKSDIVTTKTTHEVQTTTGKTVGWNLEPLIKPNQKLDTSLTTNARLSIHNTKNRTEEVAVNHSKIKYQFTELLELFNNYTKFVMGGDRNRALHDEALQNTDLKYTKSLSALSTMQKIETTLTVEDLKRPIPMPRRKRHGVNPATATTGIQTSCHCVTAAAAATFYNQYKFNTRTKHKRTRSAPDPRGTTSCHIERTTLIRENVESAAAVPDINADIVQSRYSKCLNSLLVFMGRVCSRGFLILGENVTYVLFVIFCVWCLYLIFTHSYSYLSTNMDKRALPVPSTRWA